MKLVLPFHHVGPSGNQTPVVRLGANGLYQSYLAGPNNLELLCRSVWPQNSNEVQLSLRFLMPTSACLLRPGITGLHTFYPLRVFCEEDTKSENLRNSSGATGQGLARMILKPVGGQWPSKAKACKSFGRVVSASLASFGLGQEDFSESPQPFIEPMALTWEKGDDPLFGILLAAFNRKFIQKLHLGSQTDRQA